MSAPQLTLIEGGAAGSPPHPAPVAPPLARNSDPSTSKRAAGAIREKGDGIPALILEAFRVWGDLTDDALVAILPGTCWPPTVKSARSRLTKAGRLIDTGARRKSNRDADMIVWGLPR